MSLTAAQQRAVAARGNVLVMAGAGTGKTSTLVARCLDCLSGPDPASLDQLLVVTFTEAAAAEARERIRAALEEKLAATGGEHWAQQLALFDAAHIGTLHGFCLKLVRQHFYQLGLDPQLAVLDEGQAKVLADETLGELLDDHYAGKLHDSRTVQQLIESHGGRDETLRRLVQRLHAYSQTRADAADWFARQVEMFSTDEPVQWHHWLLQGVARWRDLWQPDLARLRSENSKARECAEIFAALSASFTREQADAVVARIVAAAEGPWPPRRKTELRKPLEDLFAEAKFLAALALPERRAPVLREPEPLASKRAESELGAPMPEVDPLTEDWTWSRGQMLTLLRLTQDFTARFRERKRADGVVDFHDLEQLALELLWGKRPISENENNATAPAERDRSVSLSPAPSEGEGENLGALARCPSVIAQHWREKIRFVFVDEYQDINAAQDQIIAALSRDGAEANRFLVGDVKQSIYRFRLADPNIFRGYAHGWRGAAGQTIALAENFRSRPAILEFVNAVFAPLMCEELGGVRYDDEAKLIPGNDPGSAGILAGAMRSAETNAPAEMPALPGTAQREPAIEILFRLADKSAAAESSEDAVDDLQSTEKEARHVALRLRQLHADGFQVLDRDTHQPRDVEWRDMAVLLRAPAAKAEGYAKQFERAGVPLDVARTGFYESLEVADLLNLLRLLDNPLQDVPLLAVLRSPLVGLSLAELATIRLAAKGRFWTALVRFAEVQSLKSKVQSPTGDPTSRFTLDAPRSTSHVTQFLTRFSRWRQLARQSSLSTCLDAILAETHYADWLRAQDRGAQRHANIQRLLRLAEQFDQFQRQGLFRFLQFIEAQQAAGAEPEVAPTATGNAVRLMSVHQSKGLEFPVVVVADLGKPFNLRDLRAEIILDEIYGLCPQVKTPDGRARYPSLAHWLARQRQRRELLGEELRLLYVATTRARDKLILTGAMSRKRWDALAATRPQITPRALLNAQSWADWLRLWLAHSENKATENWVWQELNDDDLREPSATAGPAGGETFSVRNQDGADQAKGQVLGPPLDAPTLGRLRARFSWKYPFEPATQRAAKTSVTALRRQASEETEHEAQPWFTARRIRPARVKSVGKLSAAEIGTAHHKFLQHVRLALAHSRLNLQAEAQRLVAERVLTSEEATALDLAALEGFWCSKVGQRIRAHSVCVRRELEFTARFLPAELEAITRGVRLASGPAPPPDPSANQSEEFVVVQGVADLAVLLPDEVWLLDFKTDELTEEEVAAKTEFYAPQLRLYARALAGIYARPVTHAWLHFLGCGKTVPIAIAPVR